MAVALRGGQRRPYGREGLAGHRDLLGEGCGGADAPGGFGGGQVQGPGEHGLEIRLADRLRELDRVGYAEGAVVDQSGPVPGLLEALQEPDQFQAVEPVETTVVDDLDEVVERGNEVVESLVGRGRPVGLDPLVLPGSEPTEGL